MSSGWRTPEAWGDGWRKRPFKPYGRPRMSLLKFVVTAVVLVVCALIVRGFIESGQLQSGTYGGPGGSTATSVAGDETSTTTSVRDDVTRLIVATRSSGNKLVGGTTIHSLFFTVRTIELQDQGGRWVGVFEGPKEVNLMDYSSKAGILSQSEIPPGRYGLMRMTVTNGSIWVSNNFLYIYNPRQYPLELPKNITSTSSLSGAAGDSKTMTITFDIPSSVSRFGAGYALSSQATVEIRDGLI